MLTKRSRFRSYQDISSSRSTGFLLLRIICLIVTSFIFNKENFEYKKVCEEIEIPETIDFSKIFRDWNLENSEYELYGKVIHAGPKAETGHYYCMFREQNENNHWYVFNDKDVRKKDSANYVFQ